MKPQIRHMYFFTIAVRCAERPFGAQGYHEDRRRKLLLHLRHSRHPWRSSPAQGRLQGGGEPVEARDGIRRLEQRLLERELERQQLDEAAADPAGILE